MESTNTGSGSQQTAKLLPREGSRVRIDGLQGAKQHNGKLGIVESFVLKNGRYSVSVKGESTSLGIRLTNLTVVVDDSSKISSLHVLVPCHIDHDRRALCFMRCAKSLVHQVTDDYSVFVGLSGPSNFRKEANNFLCSLVTQTNRQIYLQDDGVESRPQMEHLRCLLHGGSMIVNSKALLSFVDNDDMCHPYRFHMMMEAYKAIPPPSSNPNDPYTIALSCKLLLDPSLSADEGRLENFVDMRNPKDFFTWKRKRNFGRKVTLATSDTAGDLDCQEYFDYIVPTAVLEKFMKLTPEAVASHRFCDLRLYQVFSYLEPFEMSDPHPGMWLLAHYKVSMDDKLGTFDNHGRRDRDRLVHAVDQSSFKEEEKTPADIALSERFPKLSPGQVAMCRGHLESIILSYIGWAEENLEEARKDKIMELNRSHGIGFGEELWEECQANMLSLFDADSLEASKDAWTCHWTRD